MKKFTYNSELTLKCSCGNTFPSRWVHEGKAGLRLTTQNGQKHIEKYCVRCASEDEYEKLLSEFTKFMHNYRY